MILARDLIAPYGEIQPGFFPKETSVDLDNRVGIWLDEGYRKAAAVTVGTAQDEAATNWTYHRAFRTVYLRLSAAPSSASLADQGSVGYTNDQIAAFGELADEYKALFDDALPTVGALAGFRIPPTMTIANNFEW